MKTFTIAITKTIVVKVDAEDEAEALIVLSDEDMDDMNHQQWYQAEPTNVILDVEECEDDAT
jgi:ssRNA-specific RNase YbeY (16S rRNA maturation enzyme)